MSGAETRIGCPHCDDTTVELSLDGSHCGSVFGNADQLTGTTVDCDNCGDEFEVYFY